MAILGMDSMSLNEMVAAIRRDEAPPGWRYATAAGAGFRLAAILTPELASLIDDIERTE